MADSFMKYYNLTKEDAKKAVSFCQEYLKKKGIYEAPLYEGVKELLEMLKASGKTLFVATSKPEVFSRQILQYLQVDKYFTDIVGSNMDGSKIKKDEIISSLLERNGIADKSKVVMVGDREHDIFGAQKVGIDSIGVLYGYGDYQELEMAGATYIVNYPRDLGDIVI